MRKRTVCAGLCILMMVGSAHSQPTTAITINPAQPTDAAAFDVEVWFPTPTSPPAVQQRSVEVDGSTIRIRDCYRQGGFSAFGDYRYTQTVGPLPAGAYQVEHWNAVCNTEEPPPDEAYERQAALEVTVVRGGGAPAQPVNVFRGPVGFVLLTMVVMMLGTMRLRRRAY